MSNQPKKDKTVAKCHCYRHTGSLSVKMMKSHECLKKQCPFLEKVDHPYWDMREQKKQEKKLAKKAA